MVDRRETSLCTTGIKTITDTLGETRTADGAAAAPLADDIARLATIERTILGVRASVVAFLAVMIAIKAPYTRFHPSLIDIVIGVAMVYSVASWAAVMRPPRRVRGKTASLLLTVGDAGLSLTAIAVTGPTTSPLIGLLFLTIATTGMRFGLRRALVAAMVEGTIFATVVLLVREPHQSTKDLLVWATWWPLTIVNTAVLTGALSRLLQTEQRERLVAEARAEQERTRWQEAQESSRQREELLRVVVHEFRTPVASLGALTRHLTNSSDSGIDNSVAREALDLIHSHSEHLDDMVEALSEVASSSRPDLDWRVQPADVFLPQLLRGAVAAAGGSDATVDLHVFGGPIVHVDESRVRRIVTNLVENALRHNDPAHKVDVRATCDGGSIDIVVADRGQGLSDADTKLAFQKYSTFGERRGTSGLGLWIVDQLVQRLGGTIDARSRPDGPGLEVRVWLPSNSC